jgi:hypothetical protein
MAGMEVGPWLVCDIDHALARHADKGAGLFDE